MQIETLPIDTLKPYERNARTHSKSRSARSPRASSGLASATRSDRRPTQIIAGHGRVAPPSFSASRRCRP